MVDALAFMAAPFSACAILAGMHAYLGLHVLRREVIFVDLALAQIAALGTVVALIAGHEAGSTASLAYSLAAALVGAAIFSFSRTRDSRVPQEAIIGITFVIASAATILVADRAPEGAEHIKELLAGAVIWVDWPTVLKVLAVYLALGAIHYALRRRFILISENPERAEAQGLAVRFWDFVFYALFGVVITVSVKIAGVLMVFAFLVAPAIIALAASDRWPRRLAIACSVGVTASAVGLLASYRWDLPSGPAIVCALGAMLALYGLWRTLRPVAG